MKITLKYQRKSIASLIATTLVVFAAASSAGRTLAAEPVAHLTKRVTYGDLNLESEAGAKVLYARLRFAARQVCTPFESRELSQRSAWQACVTGALESAVGKINKPLVSALHNQNVGRTGNGNS